jgi:hypothetical protein
MSDSVRTILIALGVALIVVILVPALFMGGMMGTMMGSGIMGGHGRHGRRSLGDAWTRPRHFACRRGPASQRSTALEPGA